MIIRGYSGGPSLSLKDYKSELRSCFRYGGIKLVPSLFSFNYIKQCHFPQDNSIFAKRKFELTYFFFQEKQETVQKVLRDGQKLVNGQHFDSATIKYKIGKLDKIFTEFSKKMDQQGNLLNQTVKFMCSSVTVGQHNYFGTSFFIRKLARAKLLNFFGFTYDIKWNFYQNAFLFRNDS